MRIRLAILTMGLAGALGLPLPSAMADVEFSAGLQISSPSDFYEPLSSYGAWVSIGHYGRCWHPAHVESDWRPYCVGSWEWTDTGWYWDSDEPWAWACYHYGSWVDDPTYGWCWIPGTEWAPAWVVWRDSPDYIGWAPCGPGEAVPTPSLFMFVDVHHFHDHFRPRDVIINNRTIINRTRVINDFRHQTIHVGGTERRVVVNRGPAVDSIERTAHIKFTARPIEDVIRHTPVPAAIERKQTPTGAERRTEPRKQPETPSPERTGREQPRVYEQPKHESPADHPAKEIHPAPKPEAPREHPLVPPATGKGEQRVYPKEATPPRETAPRHELAPPAQPAAPRERPPEHAAPPPQKDRDRGRDREHDA